MDLANEQVHLPACQRGRQTTFEIAAQRAIGGHAEIEAAQTFGGRACVAVSEIII